MCSPGIETHTDVEHLTAPAPPCPAQGIALRTTSSPTSLVKNRFSSIRMCTSVPDQDALGSKWQSRLQGTWLEAT